MSADLLQPRGLDPSTVTKLLQWRQRAGKVIRTTDPAGRRAVLVEATESSRFKRSYDASNGSTPARRGSNRHIIEEARAATTRLRMVSIMDTLPPARQDG